MSGIQDLVITVICLRLWLSPGDLGTATIAAAMLPALERLANLGMNAAMVREAERDRATLSTMLWLSVAGSVVVVVAAFVLRGPIGDAFDEPVIGSLVFGFTLKQLIQNVHAVPEAMLRRELRFETLSRVRIAATVADAATKLTVAYLGAHGHPELKVWTFVLGPLVNAAVTAIGLQLAHPWRPAFVFDRAAAGSALRFGLQVSIGEILYFAYSNADYIVIGKVFGDTAVGAYRLAYELVLDVVRLISLIAAEVAFPAFARLAGKPDERRARSTAAGGAEGNHRKSAGALLVRFTRQNLIALAPIVVFLAVEADDLLAVLYPPLGDAATTVARILCVVGALRVISFVLPAMLTGLGHAGDALAYQALAAIVLPAAFVIAALGFTDSGYVVVAWAWAAGYPLVFGVLLSRALARCHVSFATYVRRIAGVLGCGAIACAAALVVRLVLPAWPYARLAVTAAVIVASYALTLARVERITPRSVWRLVRSGGNDGGSP